MRRPVLCLLAAALLAPAAGAAPAGGTVRETVHPFAGGRLSTLWSIASAARGSCWTGSLAVPRPDAYRCFVGSNGIADPCFASPAQHAWVVCIQRPATRRVLRLNLSQPLPPNGSNVTHGARLPWAVRLTQAVDCRISTGANGVLHGRVALYACTDGGSLAAQVHQAAPRWWAWYLPHGGQRWLRRDVLRAWF